ncbi:MAG: gamma-butyrobetaine hydroxylase-like domain-containing protein [Thiomonas sp.]|jgi:DUF971 family protein
MTSPAPRADWPESIVLHKRSRVLELRYADGTVYQLPYELLRVYSPSAEVRGHGPGQETLQTGKREVEILGITQVGRYAIQPSFSDGHDSGIYTWSYLHHLGQNQDRLWADYLARLEAAGLDRDAPMSAAGSSAHHCSSH